MGLLKRWQVKKDARLDDSEYNTLIHLEEEKIRNLNTEKEQKLQEVKKKRQAEIQEYDKSIQLKYDSEMLKIQDTYEEMINVHSSILNKLKTGDNDENIEKPTE